MTAVRISPPPGIIREEARPSNRLLMVSNRGPLTHDVDEGGRVIVRQTDGGVASALSAIASSVDVDWVACAASETDALMARRGQRVRLGGGSRLAYVAPPAQAYDLFYNTLCNPVLWFLQHGLWDHVEPPAASRTMHAWKLGYLPVNQSIAEFVSDALSGRIDRVMFHDYHFYLAPLFVRNLRPQAVLQHFVHIPWPDPDGWMHLPRKISESICRGLLANDSIAFQTGDSVDNFLATCADLLPEVRVHFQDGVVEANGRVTRVWDNPISVDPTSLHQSLASDEARLLGEALEPELAEKNIVRVDRLDPSKNILGGFQAFESLLERHPEWRGRVRFLAFLIPSRNSIPEYVAYSARVFDTVRRINCRFATGDWEPVKVFHQNNRLHALVAMRYYDVLLVNSLADGMNLVSKEGSVINERGGVVALSRAAGSFAELGEAAIGIDPANIGATAEALRVALEMPAGERHLRAAALRDAVLRHSLRRWLRTQMDDLGIGCASVPARVIGAVPARVGAATF